MSVDEPIREMYDYYQARVPYHDKYMNYSGNREMDRLLGPLIKRIDPIIRDRDILEIACGTGNWTQVLSRRARTVLATDAIEGYLSLARKKHYARDNVTFRVADAYALGKLDTGFTAAFAADWWSHLPKSGVGRFLDGLHGRLAPGANVVFIDMLRNPELDRSFSHIDGEGNEIHGRLLPDGKKYRVIKNFPSREELVAAVRERAAKTVYHEDRELLRWMFTYTLR
jgi:demethylmenaquinone methyltransferase/2-methoxy-6-polyprenyl-1,4-benzoquinol methylase